MTTNPNHRIFLEKFVETRDVASAAKAAGIENPATIKYYYYKYKQYYRAIFEKLGMAEESTLEMLSDIAANAEKDSDRLKAIEMILKIMGTLTDTVVNINAESVDKEDEKERELAMYNKIKSENLTEKMFEILESGARVASKN